MDKQRESVLRTFLRQSIVLYAASGIGNLQPLIVIPFMSRIVEPSEFGRYVMCQATGTYLAVFFELALTLSGAREIARVQEDTLETKRVVTERVCLQAGAIGAVFCLIALAALADVFRRQVWFLGSAMLFGASQSLSPAWIYQGMGKPTKSAIVEGIAKALSTVAAVWVALRFHSATGAIAVSALVVLLGSFVLWRPLMGLFDMSVVDRVSLWRALRSTAPLLVYRGAVTAYTAANTILIGVLVSATSAAAFAAAEKITRGVLLYVGPVIQVVYPRICKEAAEDERKAKLLAVRWTIVLMAVGLLLAAGLAFFSDSLVYLFVGNSYASARTFLLLLAPTVCLISVSTGLGMFHLLPFKRDRELTRITIFCGVINLTMGALLTKWLGEFGMGCAVLATHSTSIAFMMFSMRQRRQLKRP